MKSSVARTHPWKNSGANLFVLGVLGVQGPFDKFKEERTFAAFRNKHANIWENEV